MNPRPETAGHSPWPSSGTRQAGILTLLAITTQTVSVVGPALGGLLIGVGGWRMVFAVNIPLSVVAFVLGALRLPRTRPTNRKPSLDIPGIALFAVMLVALLFFLTDPARWWLAPIALAAGAAFVTRELRTRSPFLDLRGFGRNGPLLMTYGRTLLAFVVAYGCLYGYTQWLEEGRGLSATVTGLVLIPMFAIGIVVAAITGRRAQVRGKLFVGAAAQVIACGLLLTLDPAAPIWLLALISGVMGISQGLVGLANQNAVYHQSQPEQLGASSGLLRTFGYLGAIVTSAANGNFLGDHADTPGLHHLAVFLLTVAGGFLVVTLADRSLGRGGSIPDQTAAATTRMPEV